MSSDFRVVLLRISLAIIVHISQEGVVMIEFHIKELRMSQGITQKELIERSGIRAATLSDYENNKATMIRVEHINKLCEILNCQVGDLITYKGKIEEAAKNFTYREREKRIREVQVPEDETNLSKYILKMLEEEASQKDKNLITRLWAETQKNLSRDYEELNKRLQALEATHNKK